MTTFIANGKSYNTSNLTGSQGRGYAEEIVAGTGDVLPRYLAMAADIAMEARNGLVTTSTTSSTVGTGSKSFTMASAVPYAVGSFVTVARTSTPSVTYMFGQITSVSGTTLNVNVTTSVGSGMYSDWTISLAGIQGVQSLGETCVNVEDYGAEVGGVDCYDAIVAAQAAAAGKPILFPSIGTYFVGQQLNFTTNTIILGVSEVGTIIKRTNSSTAISVIQAACANFEISNITLDGNKAGNSNRCDGLFVTDACTNLVISSVTVKNAKLNSSLGRGVFVNGNETSGSKGFIDKLSVLSNDTHGLAGVDIDNHNIQNVLADGNGLNGIELNNLDVTLADKITRTVLSNIICTNNGANGITIGNFIEDNVESPPDYGYLNPVARWVVLDGCICKDNGEWGLELSGWYFAVSDTITSDNGSTSNVFGGANIQTRFSTIEMIAVNNSFVGINFSGSQYTDITKSIAFANGTTTTPSGYGMVGSGSVDCKVSDCQLRDNGGTNGVQFYASKYGKDGSGIGYPYVGQRLQLQNNNITLTEATEIGIEIADGFNAPVIKDNSFSVTGSESSVQNCLKIIAANPTIDNNAVNENATRVVSITSNVANVPDALDYIIFNTATTVNKLRYYSNSLMEGKVAWVAVSVGGSGYTSAPTVTFTGGGGTGAAATALINDGQVVGVIMTNNGSGYTSAPTIGFTGGGGTGATATAQFQLPVSNHRKLDIYCNAAVTFTAAGTPAIDSVAGTDISISAKGCLSLRSYTNAWRKLSSS